MNQSNWDNCFMVTPKYFSIKNPKNIKLIDIKILKAQFGKFLIQFLKKIIKPKPDSLVLGKELELGKSTLLVLIVILTSLSL